MAFHLEAGRARGVVAGDSTSAAEDYLGKVREARDEVHLAFIPLLHIGAPRVVTAADDLIAAIEDVAWRGRQFDRPRWTDLMLTFISCVREDLLGPEASTLPPGVASLRHRGYLSTHVAGSRSTPEE